MHFPEEEFVPEGGLHLELRTGLSLILRGEFAGRAWVRPMLRLTRDANGADLLLTPDEQRDAALARVAELEAELRKR